MSMCESKKPYILSIALALLVGGISGILNQRAMADYGLLAQPPLSPATWVFPVVWTVLYILMGISAAMIYCGGEDGRKMALGIYGVQLLFNFCWSFFFFTLEWRFFAFVWLLALIGLVAAMMKAFYAISPKAAYLQIPYFLWLICAAYLNFGVWWLNA